MDGNRDWVEELRNIVTEAQALLSVAGADGDHKLAESLDRARAALEGLEDDASRYVRDNPWQSLGLAAAIGLLVGVLVSGRR
jgi:ElaB/YqjD/DUF883 family membrane-anchored ribosome-binding protein